MQGIKGLCWILIYTLNKNLQKVFRAASLYVFIDRFIIVINFLCDLKILTVYQLIRCGSKAQNDMKNITEKAHISEGASSTLKEGLSYCFS